MRYGAALGARKAVGAIALTLACFASDLQAEEITIAALGDSLTQGYGLAPEAGLVPQLARWLAAEGIEARLINAGVSGDTSAGGRARIGWTLTPDVDGLILGLGANDMLRGLSPAETRANLDAILTAADAAGLPVLLVGVEATGNYGPDYKAAFDGIYPDLAAAHDTLLMADFFAPLRAAAEADPNLRAQLMQPDGIHPSARGVALVIEDLGPLVAELAARAAAK